MRMKASTNLTSLKSSDRLGEDKANRFLANYFYYGHQNAASNSKENFGSVEYYDDIELPCFDLNAVANFTKTDFIDQVNAQFESETFDAFVVGIFHHVHHVRDNTSKRKSSEE